MCVSPLALHYWTHAQMHRIAALAFYALDLGLIFANVVLDYALNTGGALPEWLLAYKFYGVPATPVLAGLGWTTLFLLDPSQQQRSMLETLKASTRVVLAKRIAEAARSVDISESVTATAGDLARDIVAQTLGATRTAVKSPVKPKALPVSPLSLPVDSGNVLAIAGNGNGHKAETPRLYNAETVTDGNFFADKP